MKLMVGKHSIAVTVLYYISMAITIFYLLYAILIGIGELRDYLFPHTALPVAVSRWMILAYVSLLYGVVSTGLGIIIRILSSDIKRVHTFSIYFIVWGVVITGIALIGILI